MGVFMVKVTDPKLAFLQFLEEIEKYKDYDTRLLNQPMPASYYISMILYKVREELKKRRVRNPRREKIVKQIKDLLKQKVYAERKWNSKHLEAIANDPSKISALVDYVVTRIINSKGIKRSKREVLIYYTYFNSE